MNRNNFKKNIYVDEYDEYEGYEYKRLPNTPKNRIKAAQALERVALLAERYKPRYNKSIQ